MSVKNINVTVTLREIESIDQNDKLTVRIVLNKKRQKIPETPKEMLEKFKLSNEIGSMLKSCW